MTDKARYAFFDRNDVRAWLCALALGCVWLNAGAANKGNIGKVGQTSNGRSTTIGPVTNSTGSTIPISPSMGGWTQAGNYGMPTGATGPTVGHVGFNGEFIVGGSASGRGVKYPASGSYAIPWSTVAPVAAGIVCAVATAGACGVASGIAAATPYIMNWVERAGGARDPETGNIGSGDPAAKQSDGYTWTSPNIPGQTFQTKELACQAHVAQVSVGSETRNVHIVAPSLCQWEQNPPSYWTTYSQNMTQGGASSCPVGRWVLANSPSSCFLSPPIVAWTAAEVVTKLASINPDPRVWGEVLERGGEIPMPDPTLTGPSQIQGPERSTTNPDGTRTVERTTYNFQTSGNTINNTSNVTTTTTFNTDNSVRSVSNTTETPTAEESDEEDACEKRPNTIGCADMDTPGGEIPRETKTITYVEESVFGGGSCPSDKQWSSVVTGVSYKVVDWQTFCGYALPARFLVILLATFAAFLIVMPGKEVRT